MPQMSSFLVSIRINNFQNKHVNLSFAVRIRLGSPCGFSGYS